MHIAKHSSELEIAVWTMILILVGIASFAIFSLFERVSG
jgi:hypothetical protein